jgi:hypothetical protein
MNLLLLSLGLIRGVNRQYTQPKRWHRLRHMLQKGYEYETGTATLLALNKPGFGKVRCAGLVSMTYNLRSDGNMPLLQAIDRPLFKDFWERFRECLILLRDKHQRTVYRHAFSITTWHPSLMHAS